MISNNKGIFLKLVGGLQVNKPDGLADLVGSIFKRMIEIKNTGAISRFIGLENETGNLRFFGIEVESIDNIPTEMAALDITDNQLHILENKNGNEPIIKRSNLEWQWSKILESDKAIGEFSVYSPHEYGVKNVFHLFVHGYTAIPPNFDDDVYLVDYDSSWPQRFIETKKCLEKIVDKKVVHKIEHYGSTSIPGMPAKPVIDVLLEISSFEEARKALIPVLSGLEWEYWLYSDHMIFIKREHLMGKRTHHIHAAPAGHRLWDGLIFRDYLKTHEQEACKYAKLKKKLSETHHSDREAYTDAKTEFVRKVVLEAITAGN